MPSIRTLPRSPRKRENRDNNSLSNSPSVLLKNPQGLYTDTKDGRRLTWEPASKSKGANVLMDQVTHRVAVLSIIGRITTDNNFGLTNAMLTQEQLQDFKLVFSLERPLSPARESNSQWSRWNQAKYELRNIMRLAPRPACSDSRREADLNDRSLIVDDTFKIRHTLTGDQYRMRNEPSYAAFIDNLAPELMSYTWDDPNSEEHMHEADINPLPAFGIDNVLINPEDYDRALSGKLVLCEFNPIQFHFSRTDTYTFVGRVIRVQVLDEDGGLVGGES